MASAHPPLLGRFRGAILGAAVADALAFPYQHYSRAFLHSLSAPLAQEYGTHHSAFYPRGQYSDDTQMMLAVIDSILETRGVSASAMASHIVPLWRDNLLVDRDESSAAAMERLAKGITDWGQSALEPGHAEITPAARVVGLALWASTDAEELCEAVRGSTLLTHQDRRVTACAAAAAAAIAHNLHTEELILGPFLDGISRAASRFDEELGLELLDFPRVLSMTEYRALRHFENLFADPRYPASDHGLANYCVPALWTAVYYFLKTPYRYERTVEGCLAAGGHVDTPAFLAGAISGALVGLRELPRNLVENLLSAAEVKERADKLWEAWAERKREKREKREKPPRS